MPDRGRADEMERTLTKLVGTLVAAVLGLLVSGVAAWGLVSAVTKAPAANPANQQSVVLYGNR